MRKTKSGFTIVELLIVIVVIGILAAITIVAYNGFQARANDSRRLQDAANIQKALALYKVQNGIYPATAPNPGNSTWEISSDPNFLSSISSITTAVFKDPQHPSKWYWYRKFNAGDFSCPTSMGEFYVLWIDGMQTQSTAKLNDGGCTGQTLFTTSYLLAHPNMYAYFGF